MADFVTNLEILMSIITDSYLLADHPGLKALDSIVAALVNKYYGGVGKFNIRHADLMEYFRSVLELNPNVKDSKLQFCYALTILFTDLQIEQLPLASLPSKEDFEQYKFTTTVARDKTDENRAFHTETPAHQLQTIKKLVAIAAANVDRDYNDIFSLMQSNLNPTD